MNLSPKRLKQLFNIYPPYLGAGVKVEYISDDWKELHVSMALRWYTRNAVGTHFGGSLYAMIDPHLMVLLMQLLGKEYLVWDQSASIKFVTATKKKVRAVIRITADDLEAIRLNTENGDKYLAKFRVEIKDDNDAIIAIAKKVIYVRKKRHSSNR